MFAVEQTTMVTERENTAWWLRDGQPIISPPKGEEAALEVLRNGKLVKLKLTPYYDRKHRQYLMDVVISSSGNLEIINQEETTINAKEAYVIDALGIYQTNVAATVHK